MLKYSSALALSVLFLLASPTFAWDGYDWEKGTYVEIQQGNLVRPGRTIEIYDYGDGGYRTVEVESIRDTGAAVEVEVYDSDTGDYRTLEMERR